MRHRIKGRILGRTGTHRRAMFSNMAASLIRTLGEFEADDKQKRDDIELRNKADSMCYQVERSLAEYKDKIDEATKTDVEQKLKACREALDSGEMERVRVAMEALTQASHKMAEKMYQGSQGAGGPPQSARGIRQSVVAKTVQRAIGNDGGTTHCIGALLRRLG